MLHVFLFILSKHALPLSGGETFSNQCNDTEIFFKKLIMLFLQVCTSRSRLHKSYLCRKTQVTLHQLIGRKLHYEALQSFQARLKKEVKNKCKL